MKVFTSISYSDKIFSSVVTGFWLGNWVLFNLPIKLPTVLPTTKILMKIIVENYCLGFTVMSQVLAYISRYRRPNMFSRSLFLRYRHFFFSEKRSLRTTVLHPSRGIAPSGFRPLLESEAWRLLSRQFPIDAFSSETVREGIPFIQLLNIFFEKCCAKI